MSGVINYADVLGVTTAPAIVFLIICAILTGYATFVYQAKRQAWGVSFRILFFPLCRLVSFALRLALINNPYNPNLYIAEFFFIGIGPFSMSSCQQLKLMTDGE